MSENAGTWATEAAASLLNMKQDTGKYNFQSGWEAK